VSKACLLTEIEATLKCQFALEVWRDDRRWRRLCAPSEPKGMATDVLNYNSSDSHT
jgi:hypothetical protein